MCATCICNLNYQPYSLLRAMFTGMPFPVKPGLFVHIESEFQYIAISKGDVKCRAMTLKDFLKCKRVGDSYFCKDGNVVRDVPNYSKPPK
jgi:hypothetical protein